jgi:glycine/D-amino acid oxidase-like deaminating enzyme
VSFEEDANEVFVMVRDPFAGAEVRFSCGTLSLCTNAFTKQLLPDVDVIPGRGQVVVTDPIPGLRFKGIFHFDRGYYYFREIDGRVLFGGGRNLDFEGERTTEMGLNERIQADLDEKLANIILPGQSYEIAMRWSGIMAFGETKKPIVRSFGQRVFGAFRMGGMGVALGSTSAAELADLIEQR